jgi:hypothetical protein
MSRRRRKRERRRAEAACQRGDRPPQEADDSGKSTRGGGLCFSWAEASVSDLHLLARAIRRGWNVPVENRRPLMEAIVQVLADPDASAGRQLAAIQAFLEADKYNLRHRRIEQLSRDSAGKSRIPPSGSQ